MLRPLVLELELELVTDSICLLYDDKHDDRTYVYYIIVLLYSYCTVVCFVVYDEVSICLRNVILLQYVCLYLCTVLIDKTFDYNTLLYDMG